MRLQAFPRNKKGGVVTSTVLGVGTLLVAVIVILVITSTLLTANLFEDSRFTTTVANESLIVNDTVAVAFGNGSLSGSSCVINRAINATTGATILVGNYSVDASACTVIALTATFNDSSWNISSTTTYDGTEEVTTLQMSGNFTAGIDNVSERIPTILLIVAVVFLFGALVLLIRNTRLMNVGGGSSL
jgi:hypothetical protein